MDVDEVPATGSRLDRLAGVRPQRVQQHPVDQVVDTAPALPTLDVPVPLLGEQLVEVLSFLNALCPVAEQVIDVPKISLEDIPARRLCRVPQLLEQLVEQLVEVPTVVSYSSFLQRTVEQTVDNPASRGRGRRGGLQGFFPGQSTTAAAVDIPVPRGDLQGFLPGQGSTASSSHSPDAANEAGVGVFRTFPRGKKVRRPQPSRVRSCPPVSAWTRAAYEDLDAAVEPAELEDDAEPLIEEEEDPSGWSVAPSASGRPFFWHRISRRSVWKLPPGASVRKKKGRRKRKKRRKRRTPRTSSRPSHRRPRRRPRRWHAPGWFSSVFLLALCSSLSLAGP